MLKKQALFKTKGMNRDLSVSAFMPEFSFENRNLRLITNEGNTLMSWVNEKGTKPVTLVSGYWITGDTSSAPLVTTILGTPIGTAVINEQLVLFTHRDTIPQGSSDTYKDHIYLLVYTDKNYPKMKCKELFHGDLNFSISSPLETLVSYESSSIQKVYWVDGINQPRMINICRPTEAYYENVSGVITPINTYFDFIKELKLNEKVLVSKTFNSVGEFPAGVIQYAFTYYDKYGQESNIFYTTPLQYISYYDRAGSPEDKINNAFNINIDNVDTRFEYLRIYSIIRTSLNGTPIVRRVQDIKISSPKVDIGETVTISDYDRFLDSLGYEQNDSDVIKLSYNNRDIEGVLFSISSSPSEDSNNNTFIDINAFKSEDNSIVQNLPSAGVTFEGLPVPGTYPINEEWESQTPSEAETINYSNDDGVEFEFTYNSNEATLTKIILSNHATHVSIPAYVTSEGIECEAEDNDAHAVTTIGENVCDYIDSSEESSAEEHTNYADWLWWLRIPSTITNIHYNAFLGCELLEYIWSEIETPTTLTIDTTGVSNLGYTPKFANLFRESGLGIEMIIPDGKTSEYASAGCIVGDTEDDNTPRFDKIIEIGASDPRFQYNKSEYYVITKQDYPNLILKIGLLYYTWGEDSDESAVLYYFPAYAAFDKIVEQSEESGEEESYSDTAIVTNYLQGPLFICSETNTVNTKVKSPLRIIKKVNKTNISENSITFIDTNTTGEIIDPTHLLYLNREVINPYTIEQKDNTLFLGNFSIKRTFGYNNNLKTLVENYVGISSSNNLANNTVSCVLTKRPFNLPSKRIDDSTLSYMHTLSAPESVAYQGAVAFKANEYYRLGIQFQDKFGKWTEPIWIGDKQWLANSNVNGNYGPYINESGIDTMAPEFEGMGIAALPEFVFTLNHGAGTIQQAAYDLGYKRMRAVYVSPSFHDRTILCQGVICPTMYRKCDRGYTNKDGDEVTGNGIYAQASWLFRAPFEPNPKCGYLDSYWDKTRWVGNLGGSVEYRDTLPTVFGVVKGADDVDEEGIVKEGEVHLGERAQPDNFYHGGDYYNGGSISEIKDTWFHGNAWKYSGIWMPYYRSTEVMGYFNDEERYRIDNLLGTIHSPDVEFDSQTYNIDFNSAQLYSVGTLKLTHTYGDIDVRLKSTTIFPGAKGFIHQAINTYGTSALISGNFFEDGIVTCSEIEDGVPKYRCLNYNGDNNSEDPDDVNDIFPYLWPVYMWHRKGSLNNDVTRDGRTSELLKKKICNYRQSYFTNYYQTGVLRNHLDIKLYSADEAYQIVKLNGNIYQGCVDTMIMPSAPSDFYMVNLLNITIWKKKTLNNISFNAQDYKGEFQDLPILKLHQDDQYNIYTKNSGYVATSGKYSKNTSIPIVNPHIEKRTSKSQGGNWFSLSKDKDFQNLAKKVANLSYFTDGIPIKYKSTPHIVVDLDKSQQDIWRWSQDNYGEPNDVINTEDQGKMSIVELRIPYDKNILYGGVSEEALQSNLWIPCGPPVDIDITKDVTLPYKWGDTYLQRYECLKTYPYTEEDVNQVVEIGSFILESRINVDGRYDRNRAQTSNLHVSPTNFNKINSVYSQQDNFFNYRILPGEYYTNVAFPNQITWTETKQSGADIDLWTNVNLATLLEMDGNLGNVNKLLRINNNLVALQDKGIAQILYNERAQISTTDGQPVELENNNKVQGKRYISNFIGCSNKWSVVNATKGVYFIDSNNKSLYLFGDSLQNVSDAKGFSTWFKLNTPPPSVKWEPVNNFNNFVNYYDRLNQDVLFINKNEALAFSEKMSEFTSFYTYGNTPYFCNLEDTGVWIKSNGTIWKHNAGNYCNFFGNNEPYGMILIGNQDPSIDKTFTNLEFRATIENEVNNNTIPFDYIESWNEYQHGKANISTKNYTNGAAQHHLKDNTASLNRKFRIWRCDIPRDNVDISEDIGLNISRTTKHPMDRMRNPWIYLKLWKNKEIRTDNNNNLLTLPKVEIHDVIMTYYS